MAERPRDPHQLAKLIVDIATGQTEDTVSQSKKASKPKGRSGGLSGGKARAKALTPARRKAIARKASYSRWHRSE